jgi:hypothetical protein
MAPRWSSLTSRRQKAEPRHPFSRTHSSTTRRFRGRDPIAFEGARLAWDKAKAQQAFHSMT